MKNKIQDSIHSIIILFRTINDYEEAKNDIDKWNEIWYKKWFFKEKIQQLPGCRKTEFILI